MAKPTYGDESKAKAKNVLKVLLDFVNDLKFNYFNFDEQCQSYFETRKYGKEDINDFPNYDLEEEDGKLYFRSITLIQIAYLIRHHTEIKEKVKQKFEDSQKCKNIKKNRAFSRTIKEEIQEAYEEFIKNYVREALNDYLHGHLGLISGSLAKRGSDKWVFEVNLSNKSVKTDVNLENFEIKWNEKQQERGQAKENNDPYAKIPLQYKALIKSKLKLFVGREFVFNAFEEFLKKNSRGYFIVIGEPGIGKSAIAAKYVYDKQVPCFFNIASQGNNTTEQLKQEICSQLRVRYDIPNPNNQNNLPAVLQGVSEKLKKDKKLVIVVDALDEAQISTEEQRSGQNILCLPQNLPNNVYFLLTVRPFNQQEIPLRTDIETRRRELKLNNEEYLESHRSDMRGYLEEVLKDSDELGNGIKSWIEKYEINRNDFIQKLLTKSEINFMYLRYVTADIASGEYDNIELDELPSGLEEYYRDHWRRMKMDDNDQEMQVKVLLTLVALLTKTNSKNIRVTSEKIGEYVKKHEKVKVYDVLQQWKQFLTESKDDEKTYYGFYHKSFLDFLEQHQIKNGPHSDLYQQIEEEICESIYGL